MNGCVSGSMGLSGDITNYFINLDIIEIIQFCLRFMICGDTSTYGLYGFGWMGGSVGQWVGSGHFTK